MPKPPRIVVVGSLVMDFVASARTLPRPGETLLGAHFGVYPGGKGANQAVQAARLGAEVYLVGRVGQDDLGDQLLAHLKSDGVRTDFVRRDARAGTAACCIHVDESGRNAIIIVPQANAALPPQDVEDAADVIAEADIVLAQLEVPIATVLYAFRFANSRGIRTILNPAPAQPLSKELLSVTTYLTPNEPEAEALSGVRQEAETGWEKQAAARLCELGVANVIITLAERGCFVQTGGQGLHVPSFAVETIDTTAAGDAFCGALAVALAEGMKLEAGIAYANDPVAGSASDRTIQRELVSALRFANAAGALATTRRGAQPSLATRADVESRLCRTTD